MSSPKANPYRTVVQILQVLRLLERAPGKALPINDVAERMGVHRRTVKRWVDALHEQVDSDDGDPIVVRELREGAAWVVMPDSGPTLSASVFQYAAAYAATRHLDVGGGSLLADSAEDAVEQLQRAVPGALDAMVRRVATAFHYVPFGPKSYRDAEDTLDAVIQAILRGWTIDFEYPDGNGGHLARRVEPYTVVMYRDGLYLLGRRLRVGEDPAMRTYAVDRLRSVSADRGCRFAVPAAFRPEDHLGDLGLWQSKRSADQVVLAFETGVELSAKERTWPGAQWHEASDGRHHLRLTVTVTPEVITWILGWGASVEVLAPSGLRRRVVDQHQRALRLYGS